MKRIGIIMIFLLMGLPMMATAAAQEQTSEDRITIHELKRKMDRREKIVIVDARAGNAYLGSQVKIKGAIHLTLPELDARIKELPRHREIVIYCA